MRVLALDYGSARCGCAVSDPSGTIVTPIAVVARPASKRGLGRLRELAVELEAELVLVGLPVSLQGQDTEQTRETRSFARQLSRRLGQDIPVELYDERFTTRMAQRMEGPHTASEDSRAAAHLLESWLAARSR
ncbi:MAG TPA: Holliday junction resolvase RuvX [Solirubrobacteraceae bacterium]|nr:Holliday junction resolvase RuvX [Solirubrobacteraceae bacterium]